jgi:hypothetical protein
LNELDVMGFDPDLKPGEHNVRLLTSNAFNLQDPSNIGALEFSTDFVKERKLIVLPKDAPDPIRLVDNPELRAELRKCMNVSVARKSALGKRYDDAAWVTVGLLRMIPVNIAFDVLLVSDDAEIWVGWILSRKQAAGIAAGRESYNRVALSDLKPGIEYTPVFRPNPDIARETHDIFEIYGGELRYEPITLESLLAEGEAAEAHARVAASAPAERTAGFPD